MDLWRRLRRQPRQPRRDDEPRVLDPEDDPPPDATTQALRAMAERARAEGSVAREAAWRDLLRHHEQEAARRAMAGPTQPLPVCRPLLTRAGEWRATGGRGAL